MPATIRLGLASVREHRALYAGSFVAVALGVALIAGVVLLTVSIGDQGAEVQDTLSLLGVMAGFAGFMAIFVVASTFGFAVTARRRELGLLRLVGATPRQVRRQVRVEALVVAALAAVTGAALGRLVALALAVLLAAQGITPDRAPVTWDLRPLAISAGCGVVVAMLGAWAASRRAAKVPPAQALREATDTGRRIGVLRGVVGTLCLAGAALMLVGIRAGDPVLALMLSIFVPELVVVGLVCWGPVLLPLLVRVLTAPLREHPVLGLARANVGNQARRTTSLAAPVLAISAIAGSLILSLSFAADWDQGITRQQLAAPVVVTDTLRAPNAPEVGVIDGTNAVSLATTGEAGMDWTAEGIDPATAVATRGLRTHRGDLTRLTGRTMAISRSAVFDAGFGLGSQVRVLFPDGTRVPLRVVAIVEDAATLHEDVLLPTRLARAHGAKPTGTWFVLPAPGVDAAELHTALRDEGTGDVLTAEQWIARVDRAQRDQNQVGLIAILGPTGLYAGIAIANTLLMGSLQRRREFTVTRLVGATAAQVRRMVLAESAMVAGAALLLGSAVTATVALLLRAPMTAGLDDVPLTVPWASLLAIAAACATVTVVAAVVPVVWLRGHPSAAADHQQ
ncbi:ABC transporter permease [Nocardioides carbamazepini]|uniref:ABC transporter permease n=1 Tax=Nocardioides carbamazepini TaxID=2854259 RepID=UPI002149F204|nr:ABC transporter permease [Nocardioides carbamazepini]MCR1786023.1 ABC transporter permease [Nocardioides carbamazepini]